MEKEFTLGWGDSVLCTPGPTPIPASTLSKLNQQSIDIYSTEAEDLTSYCFEELKSIFKTDGELFLNISNGHGAWESILTNLFSTNDRILIVGGGRFSKLWEEMALKLNIVVDLVEGSWNQSADPNIIYNKLMSDETIKAVLCVHVDTASSVENPLKEIKDTIVKANHDALFIVDAIASLGTAKFSMDSWGIDVAIAASQKGLMMAPGLSFIAVNDKAMSFHQKAGLRTKYWDWETRLEEEHYKRYCGTMPVQQIYGLKNSLAIIKEFGLDNIIKKHQIIKRVIHCAISEWAKGGVVKFNVPAEEQRSTSVTTVLIDGEDNGTKIRELCLKHFNIILGSGMGHLKHNSFRIAHMGYFNPSSVLGVISAIEASLNIMKIPCGNGGVSKSLKLFDDLIG